MNIQFFGLVADFASFLCSFSRRKFSQIGDSHGEICIAISCMMIYMLEFSHVSFSQLVKIPNIFLCRTAVAHIDADISCFKAVLNQTKSEIPRRGHSKMLVVFRSLWWSFVDFRGFLWSFVIFCGYFWKCPCLEKFLSSTKFLFLCAVSRKKCKTWPTLRWCNKNNKRNLLFLNKA